MNRKLEANLRVSVPGRQLLFKVFLNVVFTMHMLSKLKRGLEVTHTLSLSSFEFSSMSTDCSQVHFKG